MMDSSTMTEAVDDYGKLATLVHGLKDEMTAMRAAQSQMMELLQKMSTNVSAEKDLRTKKI